MSSRCVGTLAGLSILGVSDFIQARKARILLFLSSTALPNQSFLRFGQVHSRNVSADTSSGVWGDFPLQADHSLRITEGTEKKWKVRKNRLQRIWTLLQLATAGRIYCTSIALNFCHCNCYCQHYKYQEPYAFVRQFIYMYVILSNLYLIITLMLMKIQEANCHDNIFFVDHSAYFAKEKSKSHATQFL